MQLTVLGSGSTIPHPRRSSSGFWLQSARSKLILDCSGTVPLRMAQERLEWIDLDTIWISHFHMDHCGGLAPLLSGTKHAPAVQKREKPLKIAGPAGIKQIIERFSDVHNYRLLEQPFAIEILEVNEGEPFELADGLRAWAFKTPHTDESHAIRIEDIDGRSLVYSADTGYSRAVAEFAAGVDMFILECTFIRDKPIEKHLELAEAISLVRQARPRRAMLTHFYPEWDSVDFTAEVEKLEPGCEVIEARDGLRVAI